MKPVLFSGECMFRKMLCVVAFVCLCSAVSAQGYQQYTQYPQYPVQQNAGPQVNIEYGVQQAPPVAQGWRGQRQPDFYHYHEHQWVPTQRYGNYCQQQPVCQPQYSYQPQNFSFHPYYYGQQPSFYVPQQQQYRCW